MAASITLQIFSYLVNFLYFFIPRFVSSPRKKIFLLSNNFSSLVRLFFILFFYFIIAINLDLVLSLVSKVRIPFRGD